MKFGQSNLRIRILFFVSLVEMALFSAPLLGWPSLIIILKEERIAAHLCPERRSSVQNGSQVIDFQPKSTLCAEQEKSLNLSHNIAVIVASIYVFLAGWGVDKYGAKAVKIFSSAMFSVSAGCFAFTSAETPQTLTPALIAVSIAHTGLLVSIMKSTVLYGKWKSPVNSVFQCALSSSAVTFLIFKVLYEQGVTYQVLCQILLYSSLVLLLSSVIIFPHIENDDYVQKNPAKTDKIKHKDTSVSSRELIALMKSEIFVATCLFIGICRLRLFFFVTTFQQFILAIPNTNIESVRNYADLYGVIQLGSLAICPLIGGLVTIAVKMSRRSFVHYKEITMVTDTTPSCQCGQRRSVVDLVTIARATEIRSCTVYYGCSGLLLILVSLLIIIPNAPLQILSFVMVALLRCFYSGGFSNLFLVAFPSLHFGKLFGIGNFVCVLIQMLQLPLFNMLESCFPMEIMKFNLSFLVVSIPLGVGYPCYLWCYARRLATKSRNVPHSCNYDVEKLLYERVTVL